jgi:hypothetical protein
MEAELCRGLDQVANSLYQEGGGGEIDLAVEAGLLTIDEWISEDERRDEHIFRGLSALQPVALARRRCYRPT